MYNIDLQDKIKKKLLELGADLVGFSKLNASPIPNQENLIYAITICLKLPDAVLKTIEDKPTMEYFHEYRSANSILDTITFKGARFIESLGYNAFPIGASQSTADNKEAFRATFPHKTGARLSGLGFIGKSGLFISKEYGSKIRLATILTDLEVRAEKEIINNGCGTCDKCVKNCPAGAISGIPYSENMKREDFYSAEKCSKHMKNYKDIGRGSVCGICIKICPYNKLN